MRVISVRQPWAWAIFHAGKDVENRSFRNIIPGQLAIHISKFNKWEEINSNLWIVAQRLRVIDLPLPSRKELEQQMGSIIGIVDVVDCFRDSSSRWAESGKWHWQLENPRLVQPVPAKGMLGMFNYTGELELLSNDNR